MCKILLTRSGMFVNCSRLSYMFSTFPTEVLIKLVQLGDTICKNTFIAKSKAIQEGKDINADANIDDNNINMEADAEAAVVAIETFNRADFLMRSLLVTIEAILPYLLFASVDLRTHIESAHTALSTHLADIRPIQLEIVSNFLEAFMCRPREGWCNYFASQVVQLQTLLQTYLERYSEIIDGLTHTRCLEGKICVDEIEDILAEVYESTGHETTRQHIETLKELCQQIECTDQQVKCMRNEAKSARDCRLMFRQKATT